MSVNRILIVVAVPVVVLFLISLGISSCNRNRLVEPTNSWVSRLNDLLAGSQKLDLQKDVKAASGWSNGLWTISNGVRQASLEILPSKKRVRKVRLSLVVGSGFCIRFEPGQGVEAGAVPVKIVGFTTNDSPLELTVLSAGGTLRVSNATGMVRLKLE